MRGHPGYISGFLRWVWILRRVYRPPLCSILSDYLYHAQLFNVNHSITCLFNVTTASSSADRTSLVNHDTESEVSGDLRILRKITRWASNAATRCSCTGARERSRRHQWPFALTIYTRTHHSDTFTGYRLARHAPTLAQLSAPLTASRTLPFLFECYPRSYRHRGGTINSSEQLGTFKDFVKTFPEIDTPEIFGLHPNADLTFRVKEVNALFSTLGNTQPKVIHAATVSQGSALPLSHKLGPLWGAQIVPP